MLYAICLLTLFHLAFAANPNFCFLKDATSCDGKSRRYELKGSSPLYKAPAPLDVVSDAIATNALKLVPTLGDVDGDGDLDLVVGWGVNGAGSGTLKYFRNEGSRTSANFVDRTTDAANNPLHGAFASVAGNNNFFKPKVQDLDGDGIPEFIVAFIDQTTRRMTFRTFQRVAGAYQELAGASNPLPFTLQSSNTYSFAFHDIDNDGDLDFFYSRMTDIKTKVNIAGPNALPILSDTVPDEISNIFPPTKQWGSGCIYLEFLDMDNDGDIDLFFFDQMSSYYYENIADDINLIPMFIPVADSLVPISEPANVVDRSPTFGDLDGDGDLDVVVGTQSRYIQYHEVVDYAVSNEFTFVAKLQGTTLLESAGISSTYSALVFGDLDNDGLTDIVALANALGDTIYFFKNKGSTTIPSFDGTRQSLITMENTQINDIALTDYNNDGRLDIIISTATGEPRDVSGNTVNNLNTLSSLYYYEQSSVTPLTFTAPSMEPGHPFYQNVPGGSSPNSLDTFITISFRDLNGDSQDDMIVTSYMGTVWWIPKVAGSYDHTSKVQIAYAKLYAACDAADATGDGLKDLLCMSYDGSHTYVLNTGTSSSPSWNLSPPSNPFSSLLRVSTFGRVAFGAFTDGSRMDLVAYSRVSTDPVLYSSEPKEYCVRATMCSDVTKCQTAAVEVKCKCPPGYTGNHCGICTAGYKLNMFDPNLQSKEFSCEPCAAGRWRNTSNRDATICNACPPGTYYSNVGNDDSSKCSTCPVGKYSFLSGATSLSDCQNCGAGTYGDVLGATGTAQCKQCVEGKFSADLGATSCQDCLAGRAQSLRGQISCDTICDKGTFSMSGSDRCYSCPPGTYGSAGAPLASRSCSGPCGPGTYSGAGAESCSDCQTGRYSNGVANSACTECMAGKAQAQPRQITCDLVCSSGTFSTAGASGCSQCPPGTFGSAGSPITSASCSGNCGPGFFSSGGSITCDACTPGKSSNGASNAACTDCEAGKAQPLRQQIDCDVVCSAGKFSTIGARLCWDCPPGRYGSSGTPISSDTCSGPCGPGKYSIGAATACSDCTAGKYSQEESNNACKDCLAGRYSEELSATSSNQCEECPAGRYSSVTGIDDVSKCALCIPGRSNPRKGATNMTACIPCATGNYTNLPGQAACKTCKSGTGTLQGTGAQYCSVCGAGTILNASTSTCVTCPRGKYALRSDPQCKFCEAGHYAREDSSGCEACAAGRFGVTTAEKRVSPDLGCALCSSGKYSGAVGVTKETGCIGCPRGRFSTQPGQTSVDVCGACAEGKFARSFGSTECRLCGTDGKYCPAGSSQPEECLADYFCNGVSKIKRPRPPFNILKPILVQENLAFLRFSGNPYYQYKIERYINFKFDGTFDGATTVQPLLPFSDAHDTSEDVKLNATDVELNATVSDLKLGVVYFFRIQALGLNSSVVSQFSEWSEPLSVECLRGGDCKNFDDRNRSVGVRLHMIKPRSGYHHLAWQANNSFEQCFFEKHCLAGGSCSTGYEGTLCGVCTSGYARTGFAKCAKCAPFYQQMLLGSCAAFAAIMICAYTVRQAILLIDGEFEGGSEREKEGRDEPLPPGWEAFLTEDGERYYGNEQGVTTWDRPVLGLRNSKEQFDLYSHAIFKIGLRHFQLAAMVSGFPLEWPNVIKNLFAAMNSVSSAGSEVFSVECPAFRTSFPSTSPFVFKSAIMICVPLVLVGFLAIYFGLQAQSAHPFHSVSPWLKFQVTLAALGIVIQPQLVSTTMQFFKCRKIRDKVFLEADLAMECGSASHTMWLYLLAIPSLLVYVLGFPVVVLLILLSLRDLDKNDIVMSSWSFLFKGYREEIYFWEPVVILRLVFFGMTSILFQDVVELQADIGLGILVISLVMQFVFKPYATKGLNTIEETSIVASWFTLFGGSLLFSSETSSDVKVLVTLSIVVINLAFLIFLVYRLGKKVDKKVVENLTGDMAQHLKEIPSKFKSFTKSLGDLASSLGSGRGDVEGKDIAVESENTVTELALKQPPPIVRRRREDSTSNFTNPMTKPTPRRKHKRKAAKEGEGVELTLM